MANVEFGTGKTVLILTIVAACFAVLWPKIFYPMLISSPSAKTPGDNLNGHLRQERPLHLRPEMIHPALREKGRAIPQSHVVPKVPVEKEPAARPPPIPGMRPPMGGAGHVVPPPKVGGTMSIVMPLYTIGIVIFFMYTIMKVFIRKTGGDNNFKDFQSDPEFRRVVFSEDYSNGCAPNVGGDGLRQRNKNKETSPPPPLYKTPSDENTRLGWKERDTRDIEIDHLRKRLEETERAMERIVAQMGSVPAKLISNAQIESGIKLSSSPTKDDKKSLEEFCTEKAKPSTKKELNTSEQAVIDESGQIHFDMTEFEEKDEDEDEYYDDRYKHTNEREEDVTTNYTTATMSGDAEAAFAAELEDTAADVSNIDALDQADDQEEIQEDEGHQIWNGDVENEGEQGEDEERPPPQSNNYQHQR